MSAQTPVDQTSPLWKAWEAYTGTEDFANSLRWFARGSPTEGKGEMWAAFCAGWSASADEITRLRARVEEQKEALRSIQRRVEDRYRTGVGWHSLRSGEVEKIAVTCRRVLRGEMK